MDRDIRDIVGESMRLATFGEIRPLWADMDEDRREPWLERAERLIRSLERRGVSVAAG